jgi:hypothetical protein
MRGPAAAWLPGEGKMGRRGCPDAGGAAGPLAGLADA